MAANRRIYIVRSSESSEYSLVKATSGAQAIRHVVKDVYTAAIPTQDELVAALQRGSAIEDAQQEAGE